MYLKNRKAQSIVEYVMIFVAITAAMIVICFNGFEPAANEEGKRDNFFTKLKIKAAFDGAVNRAIGELNKQ